MVAFFIMIWLLSLQIVFCQGYNIFYMDDTTCQFSSAQLLTDIPVGSVGSNSSGILRAAHHPLYVKGVLTQLGSLNSSDTLRTKRYPIDHASGINCSVNIVPPKGFGVVLSIRFINFRNAFGTDYLKFTSASQNFTEYGPRVDDETESRAYTFAGTVMVTFNSEYRYYSDVASGFQLTFTSVNKTESGTCSGNYSFPCGNMKCIWNGLICDGHNNCGDLSDESPFGLSNCGYRRFNVSFFGVFLSLFIIILVFSITCFYCCRRRRTLVYTGVIVRSPLTTTSVGSVNYGTYGVSPANGQNLVTPGLVSSNESSYHVSQPPLYPQYETSGPASAAVPLQHSDVHPPHSETVHPPPSPPPPYTQKSNSK